MTTIESFQEGRLADAVEAATAEVKGKPTDVEARCLLAELLCFQGELQRADKQLDVLSTQTPEAAVGVALFRQLIRAETSRREFYEQGRLPDVLTEPTPSQELQFRALVAIREGNGAEAVELLGQAEEERPETSGRAGDEVFDDFRDLDDLVAGSLEVLTNNGKFYWIPFERISSISRRPREYVRDFLWVPARVEVRDGPDGEVFLPSLYAGSHAAADEALRLGRATDWCDEAGEPVRGLGQRSFLTGEEARPLLELPDVTFEPGVG